MTDRRGRRRNPAGSLPHRLQIELAGRPLRLLVIGLYLVAAAVDQIDTREIAAEPGVGRAHAPIDGAARLGQLAVAARDAAPTHNGWRSPSPPPVSVTS